MINKSTLEDLVTPYAKAPVEYPESADPTLISYMKQYQKEQENVFSITEIWMHLEQKQTRVIYTILFNNQIAAIVKFGKLEWKTKRKFPPDLDFHYWIDVEPYRIDYRGRDWYRTAPESQSIIEQVPYGVFIPEEFPLVSYQVEKVVKLTPVK